MSLDIEFEKLNIISAGAGSGKTFIVQKTLNEWLDQNKIQAQKILAVTFTKLAANEMKTRIKNAMLGSGNMQNAQKVDMAQISTIHSFGQEIVQSFVYEQGISPKVRQLNEEEQTLLLQLSLSSQNEISKIITNLESYGYKGRFNGTDFYTPIDILQGRVMQLISSFRTIASSKDDLDRLIDDLEIELKAIYGDIKDEDELNTQLHNAVKNLLSCFPENMCSEDEKTATAKKEFNRDFRNLQKALDIKNIQTSVELWSSLQSLRVIKVDDEYKKLALKVMDIASQLSSHPLPLNNALYHIKMLLTLSINTLETYNSAKKKNALIDFSDMLYMANNILNNDEYIKDLAKNFDCLVIDEFQDTNPIQFTLLWKFQQYGIPTLIVGDLKQSIMGFQGADSSLFKSLITKDSHKLEQNWRTTSALMKWINYMGHGIYKENYNYLEPMAKFKSTCEPLQIIEFDDENWSAMGTKTGKKSFSKLQYDAVVQEIKMLLDSKQVIYDKQSGKNRKIQANDIAILAPSHGMLGTYANTLRKYGMEATIKEGGFKNSVIIEILYLALSYLVSKNDSNSAIYLVTTYLGNMSLEDVLKTYIEEKKISHELLDKIDNIRASTSTFTISKIVLTLIDTLELWDFALSSENSLQSRANLLKFIQLCDEFESMQIESLNALGIYGKNPNTFLTWFGLVDNDTQPPQKSINTQAINLLTWHASKGLEWPVVVVVGLDKEKAPRLPDVSIAYKKREVENIIDDAYIKFIPEFGDKIIDNKYIETLEKEANDTVDNLLYVSMTRAKEKLILAYPSFKEDKVGKQTFLYRLKNRCNMKIVTDGIKILNSKDEEEFYKCEITTANIEDISESTQSSGSINYGRVAIKKLEAKKQIPALISPSLLEVENETNIEDIKHTSYDKQIDITSKNLEATSLGTILHRCYEVLLQNDSFKTRLYETIKDDIKEPLFEDISNQVKLFKTHISDIYEVTSFQSEVPILYKDTNNSTISGSIDLLLETKDGYYIIDHKSDKVYSDDFDFGFNHHYAQLNAYAKSVILDKPILGVGINWIRYGKISFYIEEKI